ncbi:hypothetical protein [Parvicella tangerina]|uniref:SGNH/GDSL hydrolase family protein n=1 Tax=Parvicella tangerina TaxID=2829795 RepID=A0A916N9W2_9FLAO|nr:hypothetical protein [Parvicella tangerina]CAG5079749.1 hypothetical protein CRYO30217_01047 [Parvicella tangerina]
MNSIKGIILFVLFSLGFYLALMFGLSKVEYKGASMIIQTNDFYFKKGGDTYEKFKSFKRNELHDIVFVGSSRCYRHYNPDYFGKGKLNNWNLGTSAQIMRNSKLVIEGYLTKENCKLIVLDLFPAAFNTPGLESSADLITNASKNNVAFQVAWGMKDSRALNLMVNRYLTLSNPPSFQNEDYVGKGFCAHYDTIKKNASFQTDKMIQELEINEEQLKVLLDIIKYCKQEEVKLALVISPSSNYFHEQTYLEFLDVILPIVEAYDIPFFDYAKNHSLKTTEHFYDDSHMNIEGVKIFNERFYQDLKKANLVE